MTKKIRLMDEDTAVPNEVPSPVTNTVNDMTVKQLMKYLEAIDWKLWEMLKLMKKDAGEEINTEEKEKEE
jgi:hypothetical protein